MAFDLDRFKYFIENPSAWETFDQDASDQMALAAKEIERLQKMAAWMDEKPECRAAMFRSLQVERDLLSGKLDVAEDALKEIAGRCHNRLATIAEIAG